MVDKLHLDRPRVGAGLIIALLIIYQMTRLVVFVAEYGGVEHDGGWTLGISRSLAERGTYTSLTSTMVDPHVRSGLNREGQFTIQDEAGREYFFIGQTTGPGVVLPNALIFKLFGTGFWQSRVGGLIFFFLFLVLTAAILYFIQGLASVIIFHLYLFFFPQLYIFLGYEALGETPSMVYLLLSFILFTIATRLASRAWLWYLAAGLMVGVALNTRFATLVVFGGMPLLWLILYRRRQATLKEGLSLVAGAATIGGLWQLYLFVNLMQVADFSEYLNHFWGGFEFMYRTAQGITPVAEGWELFWLKAIILSEIAYSHLLASFILAAVTIAGGGWLVWQTRAAPARRNLLILLGTAWAVYTIWFLSGPKNAWVRYYWYGLIWMAMFIGLIWGALWRRFRARPRLGTGLATLVMTGWLVFSFSSQPEALDIFITPDLIDRWRQRQLTTRDTYLPWIIIPRAEQEQAANFIRALPPEARIYYPEGHKTAELSFLTNRIFYTLPRRNLMGPTPHDVIIIGPALTSAWKKERRQQHDILETVYRECPAIVFETPNYIVCAVEPGKN